MSIQAEMRRLDAAGMSGRQIAEQLEVNRETVAKYLSQDDFSPQPPVVVPRQKSSVIVAHTATIDRWLTDDQSRPRKQRHTAKRIFERLVAEHGYAGSYYPVQRYVKKWKEQHRTGSDGFNELSWPAGSAQVDFGQAEAIIAGIRMVLHMLVVTFPASNARFVQAFRGETAECITWGLRTIFEHVGFVATTLVLDNATGAGRRIGEQIIESQLFGAFKLHYRCQARYCNPYSGHEKGNVENAVGFLRRNLMVPEPEAASLAALNKQLLAQCDVLLEQDHWQHRVPIGQLFTADRAAGLALPGVGFDAVRFVSRKADKYGNITVDDVAYGAGPVFAQQGVTVAVRHETIEILDGQNQPAVTFTRSFDHQTETVINPAGTLPLLARKPGAWNQSLVRRHMPDALAAYLDQAKSADRRMLFTALDRATGQASFASATQAAEELITRGDRPDTAAICMLARRIDQGDYQRAPEVNLAVYDRLGRKEQPA